ncbi:MAG: NAD(P)-dependent alcohol dehydrogenase [Kiloniellales bacterium]
MEMRDAWGPDHIVPGERPDPEPGFGQVLLRMRAAALNYRDFVMAGRGYGRRSGTLPLVPVSDGAGEVVAVGDGVMRVSVGELVCPIFAQGWISGPFRERYRHGLLGGPLNGVMQEYMVLDQDGVVRAPRHMTALEAATLPCAALTAWSAVAAQGRIKAGDTVLIQGTGGVSLFALLFAKMQGARVIATSSSDGKLERVKSIGADHLINYRATPEWHKAARDLTGGSGVDHVVDVGGAATLDRSIRAVRASGTISLIGVLSGAQSKIDLGRVVTANIRMQAVTLGSRDRFQDMVNAMELHRTQPPIDDALFPFEGVGEAIKALPSGKHFGKVCSGF